MLGGVLVLEIGDGLEQLLPGLAVDLAGTDLLQQATKASVHVLEQLGAERQHLGEGQVVDEALVAGEQRNDLLGDVERLKARLLLSSVFSLLILALSF